jgi:ATP-dependent Clp protease ATP-binding subunit ClpA
MADGLLFERLRQACHDLAAAGSIRQNAEARITRLTRTGRQAEDMENKASHLVIGQDEAVHNIGRAYSDLPPGTVPGRPADRNFLFLGRTGSEKTRIVEATTESLMKNPRAVIKMDCAAFQRSHEIAKLIGSAGIIKSPPFFAPA